MTTTQDPSTSTQLQVLQGQEASLVKQLAVAEAKLKSYETTEATMTGAERELNVLVRQNRQMKVTSLRGELDAVRQQIADVRAGVSSAPGQVIARVEDGPLVLEVPPSPPPPPQTWPATEPPHFFGLEPHQLREPAAFILLLPLILALSRWIWRRSSPRSNQVNALEGSPQIARLSRRSRRSRSRSSGSARRNDSRRS